MVFKAHYFIRTILLFVLLTAGWTYLCVQQDEFTLRDKGFVSGLGYLLILTISFYLGQPFKPVRWFFILAGCIIATYLLASFVLGPLMLLVTDNEKSYYIVNAIMVAFILTKLLHRVYGIRFGTATIIATAVLLVIAYFIMAAYAEDWFTQYHIIPRLTMFAVFQTALIIPLALGLAVKQKG